METKLLQTMILKLWHPFYHVLFLQYDHTKDLSYVDRYKNQARANQNRFQSPLLQGPRKNQFEHGESSNQNRPNTSHFNGQIQNRLGYKRNNNNGDNRFSNGDNFNNRNNNRNNFNNNRKRLSDGNDGPSMPKRKWTNKRPPYNQNTSNNSAQLRMNRIRSQTDLNVTNTTYDDSFIPPIEVPNDSQELDATDITVEVINHNVQPTEDLSPVRFKMVLDPKKQAAIRVIQSKMKEKQVIFPFPVTPNVTNITMHERFTML